MNICLSPGCFCLTVLSDGNDSVIRSLVDSSAVSAAFTGGKSGYSESQTSALSDVSCIES